ncbi:substrate-binding domain-containing protein [Streptomyces sp. NPDC005925]|uniref:substrate-binding domain-containing protein n=1 Tax=Streptomyces sp. NPDC005925 TaxID=3157172 RepID=UPI0033D13B57
MTSPPPPRSRPCAGGLVRVVALSAVACLLLAGCSGGGATGTQHDAGRAGSGRLRVAMITHGIEGDAFWDGVRKGAETAAAKDHVELAYAADPDAAGQAQLVRDAVRDKVDGIAVTLAKPRAMRGPVAEARAAGIPVVGFNSGIAHWRSAGLLEYFGQDESLAGRAVGDRLDGLGARQALCVIHERSNVALEARCAGVKKTFGGETEMLYVDGSDMAGVSTAVAAALRQDPGIDAVVTLGAQYALAAVDSAKKARSHARVATFDLNHELVAAVRRGDVQFAMDQQPYLQGYLTVDALWLYRTNGNVSGGGVEPVLTGPAVVTRSNVAAVAEFAAGGTR